jgi:hypothetical protein
MTVRAISLGQRDDDTVGGMDQVKTNEKAFGNTPIGFSASRKGPHSAAHSERTAARPQKRYYANAAAISIRPVRSLRLEQTCDRKEETNGQLTAFINIIY